jgi:tetratricopeptide (TPR) repeat protein
MKRLPLLLFAILVFFNFGYAQKRNSDFSNNNDLLSNFQRLSTQQLFDTANYYLFKNSIDTALLCYGLIINAPAKSNDTEWQEIIIYSYISTAFIYDDMCDYFSAYKYLIDALLLCEKYNMISPQPKIFNNLGNIYVHFNQYDVAKTYYQKAIMLCEDTLSLDLVYNNLGFIEASDGNFENAFYYLEKALQICKYHKESHLNIVLNSMGSMYQEIQQYDSAYFYFQYSLKESRKNNDIYDEMCCLSNLGNMFFETEKKDSALFYIHLSNVIAIENNYLQTLTDNYLTISKIEESKGRTKSALENLKKYVTLKDSIFSTEIFGDINQLQRLYEISKTNQQIEQLFIEQQIKEGTIYYQKIIQCIILIVLLLVSVVLGIIYAQKRKLNNAYKILFEKHIEIIELTKNVPEKKTEKYKNVTFNGEKQREIVENMLLIMEDSSIIFDSEFSLAKLSVLLQCNHVAVSQIINTTFKKNFRMLLNSYRIKEAQKLLSSPEAGKYTIEAVANTVGFKSPNAFRQAFKNITGLSPGFYFRSIQKDIRF